MEFFENPIVVLVSIAVLFTLFGKRNKKEQRPGKKNKRSQKQPKDRQTSSRQGKRKIIHHPVSKTIIEKTEKEWKNTKTLYEKTERKAVPTREVQNGKMVKRDVRSRLPKGSAVDGIIWSVIIDEPRSRKPYQAKFRK